MASCIISGTRTVGPGQHIVFHADRPFLYLITESGSGAVFFAGKYGGKFARVSPYYFQQQAAVAVKQYSLKLVSRDVPILTSPLGEDAGVIGAGICARKKLFSY